MGDYELGEQWRRDYQDARGNTDGALAPEPPELPEALRDRHRAPLVRPDREAEMTAAYNDFTARLDGS